MKHEEYQYLELCEKILEEGVYKSDRTGTGTYSIFGNQMRFNLQNSFPLLTTKATAFRLIVLELLWILAGKTNIQDLVKDNVHIWDDWPFEKWATSSEYDGHLNMEGWKERYLTDEVFYAELMAEKKRFAARIAKDDAFAEKWGDLGPVYGKQWRFWKGTDGEIIDQVLNVVKSITLNPDSRRHIINAWKVDEVDDMALPPCHTMFQLYVANGRLSGQLYQRSADVFLGTPFNIASYALLIIMLAHVCGLERGELVYTTGDTHIYANHVEQVKEQLTRTPYPFPTVELNPEVTDIFDFTLEDFTLHNYQKHKGIKAPVAI